MESNRMNPKFKFEQYVEIVGDPFYEGAYGQVELWREDEYWVQFSPTTGRWFNEANLKSVLPKLK